MANPTVPVVFSNIDPSTLATRTIGTNNVPAINLQNIDDDFSAILSLFTVDTTQPASPQVGALFFNTNDATFQVFDGSVWRGINAASVIGKVPTATATANAIPIADANGHLNTWIEQGSGSGLDADLVRGLPADFTSSQASSGYQKLPSGLIIQWGQVSVSVSANTATQWTWTFPIAFPNACLQAFSTAGNNLGSTNTTESFTTTSASGFCEYSSAVTLTIRVLAIGY